MTSYAHLFKVLVVGDAGVGKTSLITRFVDDSFREREPSTIGTEFKSKVMHLRNKTVKISIWDTAGQERFRSITSNWYRQAHAIVVTYDITERSSFEHVSSWLDEVERNATYRNAAVLIIGNKVDLDGTRRAVTVEEGLELAKEKKTMFIECSAKEKTGVEQAFTELIEKVMDVPEFVSGADETKSLKLGASSSSGQAAPQCPC